MLRWDFAVDSCTRIVSTLTGNPLSFTWLAPVLELGALVWRGDCVVESSTRFGSPSQGGVQENEERSVFPLPCAPIGRLFSGDVVDLFAVFFDGSTGGLLLDHMTVTRVGSTVPR